MRSYPFNAWVQHAGLTHNEGRNLVRSGTIRPAFKAIAGTGDRNAFGFLDVFEGRVAGALNRIPGGMPTVNLSLALEAIRFETATADLSPSPWGLFVNPETRQPTAGLWLCWSPSTVPRVLDSAARDALLGASTDVLVMLRIDTLLIEVEQKTQDHATAAERGDAWMKTGVTESPRDVIEAAIARELTTAGLSDAQVATVLGQLREKVNALKPELRASATFVRFVEMVDAAVAINGPGPNYAKWRKDVEAFMATWKKKRAPLDESILQLLAARDAERAPKSTGRPRD